jgi:dihydrofolate reductase
MRILEKTARFGAIALAVLFIGLSLCGVFGAWFVHRMATDAALKGFGAIEIGVGVIEAGVARVDDLTTKSRTEVRQAAETIGTVGAQALANRPVLNALSERLETSLAPRVAQMQQLIPPVRDAMGAVGNAVTVLNSLPILADRAPRLAALDDTVNRLEELTADTTQLRATLRALVDQKIDVAPETLAAITEITQRIDTRLGEVQANVQAVRAEVTALQVRLDTRKSQLLFVFNLLLMISTLMPAWVIYTQVAVIQHHRGRMRPSMARRVSLGLTGTALPREDMKTQYYTASSLDGFIATTDDSLHWLFQLGDVNDTSYPTFIKAVGAIAMGAHTYEWMLQHIVNATPPQQWPYMQPTWVFTSRELPRVPGADIRFARGDVRPAHREMAAAANGRNVWIVGGGELAGQFYDAGLLDELFVQVGSVTLGSGKPLLPRAIDTPPLRLLSVRQVGAGFAELHYAVIRRS